MRAAVIEAVQQLRVTDLPEPTPGPGQATVKVQAAGICGTDVHILHGEFFSRFPIVPGHEFAGVVVAVGPEVSGLRPDDRVVMDPNIPCGQCHYCRTARPNQCTALNALGVTVNGGFEEYAVVPARNAYVIGDLEFATAALSEPLACVILGVRRAEPRLSDHALIFGSGPIGLLWVQLLRQVGVARVVVVDLSASRLSLATQLGADDVVLADGQEVSRLQKMSPGGYDLVVEATGVPAVAERAVGLAAPDARVVIFGVAPHDATIALHPYDIFRRDLKIIGSFSLSHTLEPALRLLQAGRLVTRPLISHTLGLEEFPRGLDMVGRPETMKVQVHF